MKFGKVDVEGKIWIQRVDDLPTWTAADEGRVIYVASEKMLYYGTAEMWLKSAGSGFNPVYVGEDYVADVQDLCLVDTRDGPITITLPPSPKDGAQIKFVDTVGSFESNPCYINRNGNTIQRHFKNLALDINDLEATLTYDKIAADGWKAELTGVNQIVGHATLFSHKHVVIAEDINGAGGQQQFTTPWKYNTSKDNVAVFVNGIKQWSFTKTNSNSITLDNMVPAGTPVEIVSIPIESGFNIDVFATKNDLDLYVNEEDFTDLSILEKLTHVDGHSSGLDADLLDGREAAQFVYIEDYSDGDVLTKVKNVDGHGSGLDADSVDGYEPVQIVTDDDSTREGKIPVALPTGHIDHNWLPFGKGGIEFQERIDIPAGNPAAIDIMNLDNESGYMIWLNNIVPTDNNVTLYMKYWNATDSTWDVIQSWSLEYSNHLTGPLRDFNTNADMKLAENIGGVSYGLNGRFNVNGFSATNSNLMRTVRSDVHFLSSVNNYAAFYRGLAATAASTKTYTGIRLFFNSGTFVEGGSINVLKVNNSNV